MSSRSTPPTVSKIVTQDIPVSSQFVMYLLGITVLSLALLGILSDVVKILDLDSPTAEWFTGLFDLDGEGNIPAFYSSFMLLDCAGLLGLIAATQKQSRDFRQWRFLAFVFLYLAADELLSIHEIFIIPDLRDALHLPAAFDHIWVIPGTILVGLLVFKYLGFLRRLPQETSRLFILAGLIYVGGALGMEFLSDVWLPFPREDIFAWQFLTAIYAVIIEEVLEMLGLLVFIYALLKYLKRLETRLRLNFHF